MSKNGRGFTLIELLVVLVTLGILAAVAIPKLSRGREKAFIAAVTSDLKILATQQETYQGSTQQYATNVSQLTDLTITDGVNLTITEANTGVGWAATGVHDALLGRVCGIYYGQASAANATPAVQPGVVSCQN